MYIYKKAKKKTYISTFIYIYTLFLFLYLFYNFDGVKKPQMIQFANQKILHKRISEKRLKTFVWLANNQPIPYFCTCFSF